MQTNGYVLHTAADWVAIVTGITRASANIKTGPMLQVWILHRWIAPLQAIACGADAVICGACPLRGDGTGRGRGCNVEVGKAPSAVFDAYRRGRYPELPRDAVRSVFDGASTRLGAYGDPGYLPGGLLADIAQASATHTGYTHQWRALGAPHRHYLQASVDSPQDVLDARAAGWTCYGITRDEGAARALGMRRCPFPAVQCADCGLCSGSLTGRDIYTLPAGGTPADAPTVDRDPEDWAELLAERMLLQAERRAVDVRQCRDARRLRLATAAVGAHNVPRGWRGA